MQQPPCSIHVSYCLPLYIYSTKIVVTHMNTHTHAHTRASTQCSIYVHVYVHVYVHTSDCVTVHFLVSGIIIGTREHHSLSKPASVCSGERETGGSSKYSHQNSKKGTHTLSIFQTVSGFVCSLYTTQGLQVSSLEIGDLLHL